jgi:phosphomannomutase
MTLRSQLRHEPVELKFGTSGRRGLVNDLTQLEVYLNALAEIEYLRSLDTTAGGVRPGDDFYFASDLRPSSAALAQAIVAAIADAGLHPVNLGRIPTPALAAYALARRAACIMVTGSHIPFDRNGYKLSTSAGELMKHHEAPINAQVALVRARLYQQPYQESLFDENGLIRNALRKPLPEERDDARAAWLARYTNFLPGEPLRGLRLLVYLHSAVGRDLLAELLAQLGAEVITAGRSAAFVPIDTENIDAAQLSTIQALADAAGRLDAVVSTDGDSDRPLILGVTPAGEVRFFGGDLAGMIVAEWLHPDAVVVPISCNDAIDRGPLAPILQPKTRIGSPFVIAGMEEALRQGKQRVCGWEANGGFLTASDFEKNGARLAALPTRDAFLPILATLAAAREAGLPLVDLFSRLPARFSRAALLKNFPRPAGLAIVERFSTDSGETRAALREFFPSGLGFGAIERLDFTDGLRIVFSSGDVAHVRASGNADELRIYAVADTQERADRIAALGVAEPDGILRRLERSVKVQE